MSESLRWKAGILDFSLVPLFFVVITRSFDSMEIFGRLLSAGVYKNEAVRSKKGNWSLANLQC